jgi:H-type lectin domain
VYWLAHEEDNLTISSGDVDSSFCADSKYNPSGKSQPVSKKFRTPFRRKPTCLFGGFSFIDTSNTAPIRLRYDVKDNWDKDGFNSEFSTWQDESKFYQLKASYVAIL